MGRCDSLLTMIRVLTILLVLVYVDRLFWMLRQRLLMVHKILLKLTFSVNIKSFIGIALGNVFCDVHQAWRILQEINNSKPSSENITKKILIRSKQSIFIPKRIENGSLLPECWIAIYGLHIILTIWSMMIGTDSVNSKIGSYGFLAVIERQSNDHRKILL